MDFTVKAPDLMKVLDGVEGDIARASTTAMKRAVIGPTGLKEGLRDQVRRAGFSERLANTWRGEVYPSLRNSTNPAGYVWSSAADIIDAFSRGATIRPVNGATYLWIPTKNVPRSRARMTRSGGRRRGGAMSPEEVENVYNSDFTILPVKGGGLVAFIPAVRGRNGRGERRSTTGRRAQGRDERLVAMFSLRRSVKMPKALDLPKEAEAAAGDFITYLGEELGR